MIKDFLKLEIKPGIHINFSDIPNDEMTSYILLMSSADWIYDIQEKIHYDQLVYINNKYNIKSETNKLGEFVNIWEEKISEIEKQYTEKDFLEYIKYAKELYLKTYWEEFWHKAYNNFLGVFIVWLIWDKFYQKFIKNNDKIIKFLHNEFKNIFKYYPSRWDKVWFYIDNLYWLHRYWSIDDVDNCWELDRYNYWIKYKEKWNFLIN